MSSRKDKPHMYSNWWNLRHLLILFYYLSLILKCRSFTKYTILTSQQLKSTSLLYLAILWLLPYPFSPSNLYFSFATFFLHFFSVETTWFKSAFILFPFCFAVYLRYLKWVIIVLWAFLNGRGPVVTSRVMWVLYSPPLSSDDKWLVYCQNWANTLRNWITEPERFSCFQLSP